MIVWHEDLYTVPVQRIPQITIDMTIVGGRTVYQA
jgi:predicted amidohydrolase YtcJ